MPLRGKTGGIGSTTAEDYAMSVWLNVKLNVIFAIFCLASSVNKYLIFHFHGLVICGRKW